MSSPPPEQLLAALTRPVKPFAVGGAQWPCGCASTWRVEDDEKVEQSWAYCDQHSAIDRPSLDAPGRGA